MYLKTITHAQLW